MTDALILDMIEEALDLIAEWLIAAYGLRIAAVSLMIEGHYGPLADCYGIVPITLERGLGPDGRPETRETPADARGLRRGREVVSASLPGDALRSRWHARRSARRIFQARQGLGGERPSSTRVATAAWHAPDSDRSIRRGWECHPGS